MKTPFFHFTLDFAVLSRIVEVIFCIYMLFYDWTLMSSKFVPIYGQLVFLFIGRILALFFNKVSHYNVGSPFPAPSSRWIPLHSTSTWSIMTEVSNGAACCRFWGLTFILWPKTLSNSKNVASVEQCGSPSRPFLSSRLFLLRLFGTPGTVLNWVTTKESHQLLLQMASWTWARENITVVVTRKESSNSAPSSRLWGCPNRWGK